MNPFNLKNKTILITGASSGIGKACAIACDELGASLVLMGRDLRRLKITRDSLNGTNHSTIDVDLTKSDELKTKINNFLKTAKPIDGIINSAGVSTTYPFKILKPPKINEVLDINVTSNFYLTKLLLGKLNKNGASIIFMSSVMASHGEKGKTIYSMSKGAISSGARSLAIELADRNFRVNTIAPGIVITPMNKNSKYMKDKKYYKETLNQYPLGFGSPDDVANLCVFLMSDASKWITGTEIIIDGGFSAK